MDFINALNMKVAEQLRSQRVGYLLGAGSSYLDGAGYPLAFQIWELISDRIYDVQRREDIQAKLNAGAMGIEHALDLLDDGGADDTPYRHLVAAAIADLFRTMNARLDLHVEFVRRLSHRVDPYVKVFSLNYDPLMERAAEVAKVRLLDGFVGAEHAYFEPAVFEERIGRIHGTHKGRRFEETVKPIHLLKLHGSLGWYECPQHGVRRCAFGAKVPPGTKPLMIPPQHRKAADTVLPPYAALWSAFHSSLVHGPHPLNRLACFGYGFGDEHVNAVIDAALARPDFTLLILTRTLSDTAWKHWSPKSNTVVVTEARCSLRGATGPGHVDLWRFEHISKEV